MISGYFSLSRNPVSRKEIELPTAAEGKTALAMPLWFKQPSRARKAFGCECRQQSVKSIPAAIFSEARLWLQPAAHRKDGDPQSFDCSIHRKHSGALARPPVAGDILYARRNTKSHRVQPREH